MTGLDKIIARISDDATARARVIVEAAQADCRAMAESYAKKAEATRAEIEARTAREGEILISRARSAVAMHRKNTYLTTKNAVIDEAFEAAKRELRDTDFGKYRELLTALLTSALLEEALSSEQAAAFGDEVTEFAYYEVIFNREDREKYGAAVVEAARKNALRHIGAARAEKLRLGDDTADIDGGLILRYGGIELNCSLSMLMAEMKAELAGKVAALLFPEDPAEATP